MPAAGTQPRFKRRSARGVETSVNLSRSARGQIMALVARDLAADITPPESETGPKARILEYYRYSAYGSATVLPAHDHGTTYPHVNSSGEYELDESYPNSGSNGAWDLIEDTPLTLTDNNALMLARREGEGGYSSRGEAYGRVSQFANHYTFTARRWDSDTGLMHYRYRYYETTAGRFASRDPMRGFWVDVPVVIVNQSRASMEAIADGEDDLLECIDSDSSGRYEADSFYSLAGAQPNAMDDPTGLFLRRIKKKFGSLLWCFGRVVNRVGRFVDKAIGQAQKFVVSRARCALGLVEGITHLAVLVAGMAALAAEELVSDGRVRGFGGYGNFCGASRKACISGFAGSQAVDALDKGCFYHDLCWARCYGRNVSLVGVDERPVCTGLERQDTELQHQLSQWSCFRRCDEDLCAAARSSSCGRDSNCIKKRFIVQTTFCGLGAFMKC